MPEYQQWMAGFAKSTKQVVVNCEAVQAAVPLPSSATLQVSPAHLLCTSCLAYTVLLHSVAVHSMLAHVVASTLYSFSRHCSAAHLLAALKCKAVNMTDRVQHLVADQIELHQCQGIPAASDPCC